MTGFFAESFNRMSRFFSEAFNCVAETGLSQSIPYSDAEAEALSALEALAQKVKALASVAHLPVGFGIIPFDLIQGNPDVPLGTHEVDIPVGLKDKDLAALKTELLKEVADITKKVGPSSPIATAAQAIAGKMAELCEKPDVCYPSFLHAGDSFPAEYAELQEGVRASPPKEISEKTLDLKKRVQDNLDRFLNCQTRAREFFLAECQTWINQEPTLRSVGGRETLSTISTRLLLKELSGVTWRCFIVGMGAYLCSQVLLSSSDAAVVGADAVTG